MNNLDSVFTIAIIALTTFLLRALAFWLFGGRRKVPSVISYLGQVLSYSIMAMLVVYCLKDMDFSRKHFALPEIIASASVVLIHLIKRNTLLSIASGTILYMVLIQFVFK